MKTTLTLDDDMLTAARKLATDRSEPLGRVVSDLIRRGLATSSPFPAADSGFPVFQVAVDSAPITLEDVRRGEGG